jgi:hypothetical protein
VQLGTQGGSGDERDFQESASGEQYS